MTRTQARAILGLDSPNPSVDQVKSAFRQVTKDRHPDKHHGADDDEQDAHHRATREAAQARDILLGEESPTGVGVWLTDAGEAVTRDLISTAEAHAEQVVNEAMSRASNMVARGLEKLFGGRKP